MQFSPVFFFRRRWWRRSRWRRRKRAKRRMPRRPSPGRRTTLTPQPSPARVPRPTHWQVVLRLLTRCQVPKCTKWRTCTTWRCGRPSCSACLRWRCQWCVTAWPPASCRPSCSVNMWPCPTRPSPPSTAPHSPVPPPPCWSCRLFLPTAPATSPPLPASKTITITTTSRSSTVIKVAVLASITRTTPTTSPGPARVTRRPYPHHLCRRHRPRRKSLQRTAEAPTQ